MEKRRVILRRKMATASEVAEAKADSIYPEYVRAARCEARLAKEPFVFVLTFDRVPVGAMFTRFGHTDILWKSSGMDHHNILGQWPHHAVLMSGITRVCVRECTAQAISRVHFLGVVERTGSMIRAQAPTGL